MTLQELRKRPHWSFSSLNSLLNICSLQWYFQKIAKLTPAHISVNLINGSCYHRTLDQIHLARKREMPFSVEEAQDLYTDNWRRSSKEENIKYGKLDAQEVEEQGRGLIKIAYENIDPSENILQVGEVFCVPLTHQGKFLTKPLIGEFDLVVEKEGKPLSLQATAYSYAYQQKHGLKPEVRFDVAVKNKTPVFERHPTTRNPDRWNLLGTLAFKAEEMVKHGFYYPSLESFACSGCPFKDACKQYCKGEIKAEAA